MKKLNFKLKFLKILFILILKYYVQSYAPQNLLLYFDAKSQWPAVYKQNKVCLFVLYSKKNFYHLFNL